MATQDNRMTRAPYYYVIWTEETYDCSLENADATKVYWDGNTYDSMEALDTQLTEDGYLPGEVETRLNEATEYGVGKRWVHKGLFFTEEDANNHLTSNHYHYSEGAHTYVCYAWRAPKLQGFLKALFTHFGVDEGTYKLS